MLRPERTFASELSRLARDTGRRLKNRDLAASAATLTFFSAIAIVPWLLLAVWSATWFTNTDSTEESLLSLRVLVPPDMGARPAFDALIRAGVHLDLLGVILLLFPASFYGDGLRRAALAMAPESDRFTSWRARIAVMAILIAVPPLTWAFCRVGELMVTFAPEGGSTNGSADLLLRIYIGFWSAWLVLAVLLTWVFRAVTPGTPRWRVAAAGAVVTGSMMAGFLQGFALFLSLPIDVGLPYGGLGFIGGVVAVGFWLYILHAILLAGWAGTRALDARVDTWTAS